MKHYTPGPWRLRPPTATTFYIDTPKGGISCHCSGMPKREEWEANARLIAAAPKLLDALHDLLEAAYPAVVQLDSVSGLMEARAGAQAIIAELEEHDG